MVRRERRPLHRSGALVCLQLPPAAARLERSAQRTEAGCATRPPSHVWTRGCALACDGRLSRKEAATRLRPAACAAQEHSESVPDAEAGAFFFRDMAAVNDATSSELESCSTLGECDNSCSRR